MLNKYHEEFIKKVVEINTDNAYPYFKDGSICDAISLGCNCYGFPYKEIYDLLASHKEAKVVLELTAYTWIYALSECEKRDMYDGRNEYSCKMARKIADTEYFQCFCLAYIHPENWTREKMFYPRDEKSPLGEFLTAHMIKEHKTLQQVFSSFMFYTYYRELCINKGIEGAEKELSDNQIPSTFYRTPMI